MYVYTCELSWGCGRGYLTFSLHSYLYGKFEATSSGGISVETKGIDVRPKLIAEINGITKELLGDEFRNLNFVEGTISNTQKDYLEEDDSTLDAQKPNHQQEIFV